MLLLGFDRERWEQRKAQARQQWEKARLRPVLRVISGAEIEIRDAAYWANPPELRVRFMKEAEQARERYGPRDDIMRLLIEQLKEYDTT